MSILNDKFDAVLRLENVYKVHCYSLNVNLTRRYIPGIASEYNDYAYDYMVDLRRRICEIELHGNPWTLIQKLLDNDIVWKYKTTKDYVEKWDTERCAIVKGEELKIKNMNDDVFLSIVLIKS